MAIQNKFNQFVEDLNKKKIDVSADSLFLLLTNTSPNAADIRVNVPSGGAVCIVEATSNANEIAAGNGYTKKGGAVTVTTASQTSGTFTLAANQVVFTASGGALPTFRYAVLFDDTGGTATARPVIAWWDYGAGGVTLNDGETFTVKFNNANPGTIYTLA